MIGSPALTRRARASGDDNLIPLINIVFLLLIFFMVAGHIEARQQPLVLPASDAGNRGEVATLLIEMRADEQLFVAGNPVDIDDLAGLMRYASESAVLAVEVRADRSLVAEQLAPLLRQVSLAGASKVALAVNGNGEVH